MKCALVEYETIDSNQVDDLMARRKVRLPKDWHNPDNGSSADSSTDAAKDSDDSAVKPEDPSDPISGPAVEHWQVKCD